MHECCDKIVYNAIYNHFIARLEKEFFKWKNYAKKLYFFLFFMKKIEHNFVE